jgi:hypothetical protein
MPPDAFAERVHVIRGGLEPALWNQLVAEIPELETLSEA